MNIRLATIRDIEQLVQLFRDTILTINRKDYNETQVNAWADSSKNTDRLKTKLDEQYFIIAENDSVITGFSSLTPAGYLDFMYVHKDHQHKGIATQLLNEIIKQALKWELPEITTDASITAKPFFEKCGFKVTAEQKVYIIDVMLVNYKMHYIIKTNGAA
jgi:putative acetyltransferase